MNNAHDDNWNKIWQRVSPKCRHEERAKSLSRHCFIQMKKAGGGGSISNTALNKVVNEDKDKILAQLSIYSPDYIVACGNGEQLIKVFDSVSPREQTKEGVGYWMATLKGKECTIIDYCHPSVRAGTKIKGQIAFGLSSAIQSISRKS